MSKMLVYVYVMYIENHLSLIVSYPHYYEYLILYLKYFGEKPSVKEHSLHVLMFAIALYILVT